MLKTFLIIIHLKNICAAYWFDLFFDNDTDFFRIVLFIF